MRRHLGALALPALRLRPPAQRIGAPRAGAGAERMRTELAWREFYADVLWHRPDSARAPLLEFGARLRWDTNERARERFAAWATGTTGYPLVDAGMRQLLAEGWMHNRVRMVTASFLVKDLHIDWRLGARWFMWHLVDGDLASNQHGWQWVAGTGTDAAPFHRVLNPIAPAGALRPDRRIREPLLHARWTAPSQTNRRSARPGAGSGSGAARRPCGRAARGAGPLRRGAPDGQRTRRSGDLTGTHLLRRSRQKGVRTSAFSSVGKCQ